MLLQGLIQLLQKDKEFQVLLSTIRKGVSPQVVYGLPDSAKVYFLATMINNLSLPVLVITPDEDTAKRWVSDLSLFISEEEVSYFPPREILPYEVYAYSQDLLIQRLTVLQKIVCGATKCVVVPASALSTRLVPKNIFAQSLISLRLGETLDLTELVETLVQLGYERVDPVEVPGQFSVRGGIVDVFSPTSKQPVRIEFFGDTIDSLRLFDVDTQRSNISVEEITISPAREFILLPEAVERSVPVIEKELEESVQKLMKLGKGKSAARLQEKIRNLLEKLKNGVWEESMEQLISFFYSEELLFQYFPREPLIVIDEVLRLEETMKRLDLERASVYADLMEEGELLPSQTRNYVEYRRLMDIVERYPQIYFSLLPQNVRTGGVKQTFTVSAKSVPSFSGKVSLLVEELKSWRNRGYRMVFLTSGDSRQEKLREYLWEQDIEALKPSEGVMIPVERKVLICSGVLSAGFELPHLKLVVLTDAELFGQQKRPAARRTYKKGAVDGISLTTLKEGDYVVHVQHGIARYLGIQQVKVGGVVKDYFVLQYAGDDRLYVPTDQAKLIHKYSGAEGHVPRLNRLGGNDWTKVKSKVKRSVEDMARELLELYAARQTVEGYAFSPDSVWQKEFEEAFPYQETPDQLRAIEEVKRDMMQPKPMDRLLCGDVGYGKTEVAMRAAFKAVLDGKQVAVLVPTTILAQQHYYTFKERFSSYPVNIAVLSRFRTPKEQRKTIKELRQGLVDIVIGTHRLLSEDVTFKDLGLLIIDEEQRFGVAHKEKLKKLRQNVDVLTLSATPIPRTLHMSLAGVRDMSVIETPPEDRYPVQTYVVEYTPQLIQNAIRRELERKGQVYFVHNRVSDIEQVAENLQKLVPEARIAIAHGQMKEDNLEEIMMEFMEGKYDVLVCTTIIENGLDIGNVNTLIVDEADRFGLAQLYQLRGRVGRTNRLAFAYFTYRKDKILNSDAEKRLNAIREFTEFGAGLKLALRDLEIRGAGNILGPEQHGHLLAVGFDLYMQLLEEAVRKLKGVEVVEEKKTDPSIELNVNAYIPNEYIEDTGVKMEFYRRLTMVQEPVEVEEIAQDLKDRYGNWPPVVENLLTITRIKALARKIGIEKVVQQGKSVIINFAGETYLKGPKLMELAGFFPGQLSFSSAGGLSIRLRLANLNQQEILKTLSKLLYTLNSLHPEEQADIIN
ncbi:transcription-repair coupling factor [Calderihabitans maritimus]|uniref:Transcription-repair-coupling factor n=1 Tax=Calderihabitans maritimus TaxID=1246530 RepID=A0A1Z5HQ75_9FIRM|nr:transcription-repair coupling factor [Calderihabitans maritimus]GAW91664.1 transcription-repair coupling factor [Calderihabitans maritimus]